MGVSASEKGCWVPSGGSRPIRKDRSLWEEAPLAGVGVGELGRGQRPQTHCPTLPVSPRARSLPAPRRACPLRPAPGTRPAEENRAGSGCLPTSSPDRNLLFYVPAPVPAPGNPTADCLWGQEAGGRAAEPSCMPTAWLLAAGAGVGGTGAGRQDSGPYTTEQGLPHRRGLHPQPEQPASCRTRPPFHGELGSLEGNVPRTH